MVVHLGVQNVNVEAGGAEQSSLMCCRHSYKSAELFCSSCLEPVCNQCLLFHTTHELETIPSAAERCCMEMNDCTRQLNDLMSHFMEYKQRVDATDSDTAAAEADIKRTAEELKRMIDEHSTALLNKLHVLRLKNAANREKASCSSASMMMKIKTLSQELVSSGSLQDLFRFGSYVRQSTDKQVQTIGQLSLPIDNRISLKKHAWMHRTISQCSNVIGYLRQGMVC